MLGLRRTTPADEALRATGSRDLADLGDLALGSPSVQQALDAIRECLGVDVAWVGALTLDAYRFEHVSGDSDSFGFHRGRVMKPADTYCQRMLDGRIGPVINDTAAEPRVASLPVTEEGQIGSYIAVPLTLADGTTHGALCAANHEPDHRLDYRDLQFLRIFGRMVADAIERRRLESGLRAAEVRTAALTTLLAAVAARDEYTADHSEAVVDLAVDVARRLGLDDDAVDEVRDVALLHDVGKIGIPDAVLAKDGPLDDAEWATIRTHPERGAAMVAQSPGLEHLAPMVRAEHERWDGRGYPDGLAGTTIPLPSRITLVCDAFHAMVSDRPYRDAMSSDEARFELEANCGSQFCPASTVALLDVIGAH